MATITQPLAYSEIQGHSERGPRAPAANGPSKTARYTSYALTGLAALFLAFDAALKVFGLIPENEPNNLALGFPHHLLSTVGWIQVACLALWLIPRTAVVGALLWTGYLGGAIALHVRVEHPLFSHTLFPIYVALMIWGGLFLRDGRARALFSPRGPWSGASPDRG
jgi:hypothetical protein